MSERYPGGLIRKTPPTVTGPTGGEGGSAPGIWTLEEVAYYQKEGLWPKKILPKETYGWGQTEYGQLGTNTYIPGSGGVSSPVQVGAQDDWSSVSSGLHTLFLRSPGELYAVGYNFNGQVGDGTTTNRSSPVQIGALTNWTQISSGNRFSAAIKDDGTLWTWGNGAQGRLGHNSTISKSSPTQVGALTDWASVEGGGSACIAVKTDGSLWSWGYGLFAVLGQNNIIDYSSPVQIGALTNWSVASCGNTHGMAIKTDGTIWGWGFNVTGGPVGDNTTIGRSSPVQIGTLTNWSKVSAGANVTGAIKTDGTLWMWGNGSDGELGNNLNGTAANRSSPIQIGALTNWSNVQVGVDGVISIRTDGTLWTWGAGDKGQIGNNDNLNVSSPVQIGTSNWSSIGTVSPESRTRHALEKVV
jgi:alpha-tubulin suppressor-like RCC1 family protein